MTKLKLLSFLLIGTFLTLMACSSEKSPEEIMQDNAMKMATLDCKIRKLNRAYEGVHDSTRNAYAEQLTVIESQREILRTEFKKIYGKTVADKKEFTAAVKEARKECPDCQVETKE